MCWPFIMPKCFTAPAHHVGSFICIWRVGKKRVHSHIPRWWWSSFMAYGKLLGLECSLALKGCWSKDTFMTARGSFMTQLRSSRVSPLLTPFDTHGMHLRILSRVIYHERLSPRWNCPSRVCLYFPSRCRKYVMPTYLNPSVHVFVKLEWTENTQQGLDSL